MDDILPTQPSKAREVQRRKKYLSVHVAVCRYVAARPERQKRPFIGTDVRETMREVSPFRPGAGSVELVVVDS